MPSRTTPIDIQIKTSNMFQISCPLWKCRFRRVLLGSPQLGSPKDAADCLCHVLAKALPREVFRPAARCLAHGCNLIRMLQEVFNTSRRLDAVTRLDHKAFSSFRNQVGGCRPGGADNRQAT